MKTRKSILTNGAVRHHVQRDSKQKIFVSLIFLFFVRSIVFSESFSLSLFPKQNLLPVFSGNGTAHRFSIAQIFDSYNVIASLGGQIPMIKISYSSFDAYFSAAASSYIQLNPMERANLVTTDYVVDFFVLDIPFSPHTVLRIGPGHTSHHLSDNEYENLQYKKSILYIRDYWQAFIIQQSTALRGFMYAGVYYSYTFVADKYLNKPWLFEIGFDGGNTQLWKQIFGYLACDIKLRQESNFATTQNYQLGIKRTGENNLTYRLAINYRTGLSEEGQFYSKYTSMGTLGFYIDF